MKKACNVFGVIALILVIVGALNWLLVGVFSFNLVSWITMGVKWLESLVYIVVGIAGIYVAIWLISNKFNICCSCTTNEKHHHNGARNY